MMTVAMKLKDACSFEEKTMTNLYKVFFKSRDINLLKKFSIIKAMIFPVVMYGCESWTIKKTERRRTDVFKLGVGEDS